MQFKELIEKSDIGLDIVKESGGGYNNNSSFIESWINKTLSVHEYF